mmetsp:Transcript_12623/g.29868  ORF Transcript_12623/g.29868 Transcript_12623/m.29868 type:complete len:201 (+) Transcript_12623:284-886(+)
MTFAWKTTFVVHTPLRPAAGGAPLRTLVRFLPPGTRQDGPEGLVPAQIPRRPGDPIPEGPLFPGQLACRPCQLKVIGIVFLVPGGRAPPPGFQSGLPGPGGHPAPARATASLGFAGRLTAKASQSLVARTPGFLPRNARRRIADIGPRRGPAPPRPSLAVRGRTGARGPGFDRSGLVWQRPYPCRVHTGRGGTSFCVPRI